jgi:hypothetical protein
MRTATSIPSALCAAVSLLIIAPRDWAQLPITPVVVSSKTDPSGSIYNITINDAGVVTTKLRAHGVGALYAGKAGDLHLVASEGGMIHDLKLNIPVPITLDGEVAFGGDLSGGVNALFAGPSNNPSLVARQGAPAPGVPGTVYADPYALSFPSFSQSGGIIYANRVAGPGVDDWNQFGLWGGTPQSPTLLFRSGDPAPGLSDGARFWIFGGGQINSAGQILFQNILNPPMPSDTQNTCWFGQAGSVQLLYRGGLPAPGVPDGIQFTSTEYPDPNTIFGRDMEFRLNQSGQVAFFSFLRGPGVDTSNDSGIWAGKPGALQLLARTGEHAPGTLAGVNFGLPSGYVPVSGILTALDDLQFNNAGHVAFNGSVTGSYVTNANNNGLWRGAPGALKLVAREGDAAPGMAAGVTFAEVQHDNSTVVPFDYFTLSDTGEVAFVSGLSGPGVEAGKNDVGMWAADLDGNVFLIARSGDLLDVGNGELRKISFLVPNDFNAQGKLAFIAEFTDGTNGAFITDAPEPQSVTLLTLLAGIAIGLRRRPHQFSISTP